MMTGRMKKMARVEAVGLGCLTCSCNSILLYLQVSRDSDSEKGVNRDKGNKNDNDKHENNSNDEGNDEVNVNDNVYDKTLLPRAIRRAVILIRIISVFV